VTAFTSNSLNEVKRSKLAVEKLKICYRRERKDLLLELPVTPMPCRY